MTPEEMERTMQFIVQQQAQFVVDIQKLMESQARLEQSQVRLEESHEQLTEATLANTAMIGRIAEAQLKLAEAQAKLTEAQINTDNKLAELAGRLDTFIVVVERHIAEGQNGKRRRKSK